MALLQPTTCKRIPLAAGTQWTGEDGGATDVTLCCTNNLLVSCASLSQPLTIGESHVILKCEFAGIASQLVAGDTISMHRSSTGGQLTGTTLTAYAYTAGAPTQSVTVANAVSTAIPSPAVLGFVTVTLTAAFIAQLVQHTISTGASGFAVRFVFLNGAYGISRYFSYSEVDSSLTQAGGAVQTLNVAMTGTGSVLPTLRALRALSIAMTGTGNAAANAIVLQRLNVALTGTATVSPVMIALRALSASLSATGTINFTPIALRRLDAVLTGTATVAENLSVLRSLSAALTGTGTVLSSPILVQALNAAMTGTGVVTVELIIVAAAIQELSVALLGQAVMSPGVTAIRRLNVAMSGSANVVEGSIGIRRLSAALTGLATVQEGSILIRALTVALSGTATLQTSLAAIVELTASLLAQANLSPGAVTIRVLNSVMLGSGVMVAQLQVIGGPTIDGQDSVVLGVPFESLTLVSDGTEWWVL